MQSNFDANFLGEIVTSQAVLDHLAAPYVALYQLMEVRLMYGKNLTFVMC